MTAVILHNAMLARQAGGPAKRVVVVVGDEAEARYWAYRLDPARRSGMAELHGDEGPTVLVEKGRRGNFLGTLAAYHDSRSALGKSTDGEPAYDQIMMLLGTGSRLSPFTQALRNIKAAFPLPDLSSPRHWSTVGEAAIRAGVPLADFLHRSGFNGILVRWGDEIVIPGSDLSATDRALGDMDAVRFGSKATPTGELASQKEWLVQDLRTGTVIGELPRQPLDSLQAEFAAFDSGTVATYVNLGSFAMSEHFLRALCDTFRSHLDDPAVAANWDPYFWMAFHCADAADWQALVKRDSNSSSQGLMRLLKSIPDFFELAQKARRSLAETLGREPRVGLFDFGQPYWIDIGSHEGLGAVLSDIFDDSLNGSVVRAFLGFPESLTTGESLILGSTLPPGITVEKSIVLDCRIKDAASSVVGAVVIGGDYNHLTVEPGGAAIQSRCDSLRLIGNRAFAFRVECDSEIVQPGESLATVLTPGEPMTLRYHSSLGTLSDPSYQEPVAGNVVSFREAARLVSLGDPIEIENHWTARPDANARSAK